MRVTLKKLLRVLLIIILTPSICWGNTSGEAKGGGLNRSPSCNRATQQSRVNVHAVALREPRRTFAAPVQRVEAARVGEATLSPLPERRTVPVSGVSVPPRGRRVRGERPVLMARTGRQSQNAAHQGATLPTAQEVDEVGVYDSFIHSTFIYQRQRQIVPATLNYTYLINQNVLNYLYQALKMS